MISGAFGSSGFHQTSIGEQTTEKESGGKAAYFSNRLRGAPWWILHSTAVALLNTNHFRTSDLLRCSVLGRFSHGSGDCARKTPFVWFPTLFANEEDSSPPVLAEPFWVVSSFVKLGRQRGQAARRNFRCQWWGTWNGDQQGACIKSGYM